MFYALIAAFKDPDLHLSDIRSFADAAAAKAPELTDIGLYGAALAPVEGDMMFNDWKEARESMLIELETHVKGAEAILAKLGKVEPDVPSTGEKRRNTDSEVKGKQPSKKRKSEQVFEQIEKLAATVKKLKREDGS